jgi:hypothetical protein
MLTLRGLSVSGMYVCNFCWSNYFRQFGINRCINVSVVDNCRSLQNNFLSIEDQMHLVRLHIFLYNWISLLWTWIRFLRFYYVQNMVDIRLASKTSVILYICEVTGCLYHFIDFIFLRSSYNHTYYTSLYVCLYGFKYTG